MTIRWSPPAADDFAHIVGYIHEQNRSAAQRVARRIHNSIAELPRFPYKGRIGRVAGTRELVLAPLPYVVVYRITAGFLEIARILHGAQSWP